MKPILIFRFTASEGPGYILEYLQRHTLEHTLIAIDQGDAIPTDISEASALVLMGGTMSVNDPLPWIAPMLNLIRTAIAHNLPVLGHCLGGQLISKAQGGEVTTNPVKEFGWHRVTQQDNAESERWLTGLPESFDAFHWHGETFSIPQGGTRILGNAFCTNQGFVIGNTLALQCHIEMTCELVTRWADLHPEDIATPSASVQNREQIMNALESRVAQLQANADKLYDNWCKRIPR